MKNRLLPLFFTALALIVLTSLTSISQTPGPVRKSRVFIAPTQDGFSNFVSAAFLENKLPFDITTDDRSANYIVVCSGVKGQNKWYDTVFGVEKDRNQGSMKLVRVSDRIVVWAAASGDRSLWFGEFKSMGQSKVANRLARKLKDDIPKLLLQNEDTAHSPDETLKSSEILASERPVIAPYDQAKSPLAPVSSVISADGYNVAGLQHFQKQNLGDAEAAFRESIRLDPYNAIYHYNLGCTLNGQRKFDEAEKEMELATRLEPTNDTFRKSLETVRANKPRY